ncbi:MAG: bacteriohemerythrin [Bryobacteraceae bacterium]|jgi:hemerythrin-like metal-binding protein
MALFTWSPEYSVGNDLIDAEHRTLFEMADRLHGAMLSGGGKNVLRSLFVQLADYTRTHFAHEEALMAKHAYPQLPAHAEIHRQLIAKLSKLQDDLNGGKLTVTMDTMQFLRDWLQHHIGKTDRLVASHVREAHMAHR